MQLQASAYRKSVQRWMGVLGSVYENSAII